MQLRDHVHQTFLYSFSATGVLCIKIRSNYSFSSLLLYITLVLSINSISIYDNLYLLTQ